MSPATTTEQGSMRDVKQDSSEAGFTVGSERKSNILRLKKGQAWL